MSLLNKIARRLRVAAEDPWTWLGSDHPKVIAGGQSHRMALVNALRSGLIDLPVAVLTNKQQPLETDRQYWAKIARQPPDIPLALVWVGNEMNANFLLEQDPPFRVFGTDGAEELMILPAEMLKGFVLDKLQRLPPVLSQLAPRRIVMVGPPPPKSDRMVRQQLAHEGFLVAKLRARGLSLDDAAVTPFTFRLRLWHLHRAAFCEMAEQHGLPVLAVPEEAVDAGGALKDEYGADDATHANAAYGALVWRMIGKHFVMEGSRA